MENLLLWPMKRMMERMPADSPPKVTTSGIRRLQEQNEELLALLRDQSELLRERAPAGKILPRG
jgi:hypothetical protein